MTKKYVIVENDENWDIRNAHFRECRKLHKPYIYIDKRKGKYWRVAMDNVHFSSCELRFISEKIEDNCSVLFCLEHMKIVKKQKGCLSRLGNICYYADVKKEYAEYLAEFLYDIHMVHLKEHIRREKLEARQKMIKKR